MTSARSNFSDTLALDLINHSLRHPLTPLR